MTEEQVKEQLSNRYVGVLATNCRFTLDKGDYDHGIDYTAKKTYTYILPGGKHRMTTDPRAIDIQLKATTEKQITDTGAAIKYDLEVKNYTDLITRAGGLIPLILILFVMPDDKKDWIELTPLELRVRRHAYWFQPPAGSTMPTNTSTIRITIPKTNILNINCFDTLHTQFYP